MATRSDSCAEPNDAHRVKSCRKADWFPSVGRRPAVRVDKGRALALTSYHSEYAKTNRRTPFARLYLCKRTSGRMPPKRRAMGRRHARADFSRPDGAQERAGDRRLDRLRLGDAHCGGMGIRRQDTGRIFRAAAGRRPDRDGRLLQHRGISLVRAQRRPVRREHQWRRVFERSETERRGTSASRWARWTW